MLCHLLTLKAISALKVVSEDAIMLIFFYERVNYIVVTIRPIKY